MNILLRWSAFVLISVNNQHYQSRVLKRIGFAISELEEGITLSATSIFGQSN
jgi:hypothetical protein